MVILEKNKMIKNYLVSSVRPIGAGNLFERDNGLYLRYTEMYKLSLASCKHFFKDRFEPIVFTDPVSDVFECTKKNWYEIKKLWEKETCNILWLGADTLMVKPTELFTKFKEFRMFNYTDPKSYKNFNHYLNDDVRFFPHTMNEKVWQLGEMWWIDGDKHPEKNWGFDQLRHNAMFWSQNIDFTDVFHPGFNFMFRPQSLTIDNNIVKYFEYWNNLEFNKAHILHLHGSRGSENTILYMNNICQQLGIKI